MFGIKNSFLKNKEVVGENAAPASFDLEKIPIRTMKKDLETAKNRSININPKKELLPSNFPQMEQAPKKEVFIIPEKPRNLPPIQPKEEEKPNLSASPFLSKEDITSSFSAPKPPKYPPQQEATKKTFQETPPTKNQEFTPTQNLQPSFSIDTLIKERLNNPKREALLIKEETRRKTSWGRLFFLSASIFIFILSGFSIYYYQTNHELPIPSIWLKKLNEITLFEEITSQNQSLPSNQENISFSEKNPNYLNIGSDNADPSQVRNILLKHSQKVLASQISIPVEFIPTNSQNIPLSFKAFAKKINLGLSQNILSRLSDDNFGLFYYNDEGKIRLGLSIPLQPGTNIHQAILQEESNLAKELEPIFLSTGYTIENKPFGSGDYAGLEIRYLNIISPEELSIDYTIFDNRLIIGTTKMTVRAIIDKIKTSKMPTENPINPTSQKNSPQSVEK